MDLTIGIALWLAAGAEGFVEMESGERVPYRSRARCVLLGTGAGANDDTVDR